MRKITVFAVFSAAVLILALLAGCGGGSSSSTPSEGSNVTQPSVSGSSKFSQGPDAGSTVQLKIAHQDSGPFGTTGGSTTTSTSTTGDSTISVSTGGQLTGTLLVIAGSGSQNRETIELSGTATRAQDSVIIIFQLTGTDSSSGTTYTVTGQGPEMGPTGLTGDAATVTSSTGDSGTVSLN